MITLIAIRKVISEVPSWVYAGVALFAFGFFIAHQRGVKKFEAYKVEQAAVVQEWKTKAETVTTKTVIEYVDRIQVVTEKGESIIKKVPVYVPRNVCVLPPGFRSVLDAAATGGDLPDSPRTPDETPKAPSGTPRETERPD